MRPHVFLVAWAALLIAALLWPFVSPGALLYRDMAVLAHPALTESALGFGDLPARNAPQDGLLAVAGAVVDASWVARGLLLAGATLGAYGAMCVARLHGSSALPAFLALSVTLLNPFVVERLLQGQWSLAIAAWLLPGIAVWSSTGRWQWLFPALWLASLTPTGAVVGVVVALVVRYRHVTAFFGVLISLPWLVPSVWATPSALPAGASMFAARAEHWVGTVGAVLGLGGIWNQAAVPPSRETGCALAGVALFAVLLTALPRLSSRLTVLFVLGLLLPILMAFAPGLTAELLRIPGVALFRDSHKLVMFAIPGMVFLASALRPKLIVTIALVASLVQLWDAPLVVAKLRPLPEPQIALPRDRDTFIPELSTLASVNGVPTANPLTKAAPLVENGELRVDGTLVDAPSPRFSKAQELYASGDTEGLRRLGIGAVLSGGELHLIGPPQPRSSQWWVGAGLLALWLSAGVAAGAAPWLVRRRFVPKKTRLHAPAPPARGSGAAQDH